MKKNNYPLEPGNSAEFTVGEYWTPKEGGIFTHIKGFEYPYRGYPVDLVVNVLSSVKGMVPLMIQLFTKSFIIPTPRRIKAMKEAVRLFLSVATRELGKNKILPHRYCKSVKEIYRAIEVVKKDDLYDRKKNKELNQLVKEGGYFTCSVLEFDNAYRYRAQDVMPLIDKKMFKKNPAKETKRIFTILIDRDNSMTMKQQWKHASRFVYWGLRFNKSLRIFAKKFVQELNLEELKMQEDDEYWCGVRTDYNFNGEDYTNKGRNYEELVK